MRFFTSGSSPSITCTFLSKSSSSSRRMVMMTRSCMINAAQPPLLACLRTYTSSSSFSSNRPPSAKFVQKILKSSGAKYPAAVSTSSNRSNNHNHSSSSSSSQYRHHGISMNHNKASRGYPRSASGTTPANRRVSATATTLSASSSAAGASFPSSPLAQKLSCPQCGEALTLALKASVFENETSTNWMSKLQRQTRKPKKTYKSTETTTFKEGDICRCEPCKLYFAVKAERRATTPPPTSPTMLLPESSLSPSKGGPTNPKQLVGRHARPTGRFPPSFSASSRHVHATLPATPLTLPPIVQLLPAQVYEGLSEYVIGQHHVKRTLAVGLYNHTKRLEIATAARQKKLDTASEEMSEMKGRSMSPGSSFAASDALYDPTLHSSRGVGQVRGNEKKTIPSMRVLLVN